MIGLGAPPRDQAKREQWFEAVSVVAAYRERWNIGDDRRPTGADSASGTIEEAGHRMRAELAVARARPAVEPGSRPAHTAVGRRASSRRPPAPDGYRPVSTQRRREDFRQDPRPTSTATWCRRLSQLRSPPSVPDTSWREPIQPEGTPSKAIIHNGVMQLEGVDQPWAREKLEEFVSETRPVNLSGGGVITPQSGPACGRDRAISLAEVVRSISRPSVSRMGFGECRQEIRRVPYGKRCREAVACST